MELYKPRQARKGATVVETSCAGVWLEKVISRTDYSIDHPVMKNKSVLNGFTLTEMLVVIMIIAILLTLAIPDQTPRTTRKQLNDAIHYCDNIKPAIETFYKTAGTFPADNTAAGLLKPEQYISTVIKQIEIKDGAINITMGNNALSQIRDQILTLQPLTVTNNATSPIDWSCGFSKVPDGMQANGKNKTSIKLQYLPFDCLSPVEKK